MFTVYIIRSVLKNKLYIGCTGNLEQRIRSHNAGLVTSTKYGFPWELKYTEEFECKEQALKRERFLKKQKNRAFYNSLFDTECSSDG